MSYFYCVKMISDPYMCTCILHNRCNQVCDSDTVFDKPHHWLVPSGATRKNVTVCNNVLLFVTIDGNHQYDY